MKKKYHIDALNKSTFGVTYYDACRKDCQRPWL